MFEKRLGLRFTAVGELPPSAANITSPVRLHNADSSLRATPASRKPAGSAVGKFLVPNPPPRLCAPRAEAFFVLRCSPRGFRPPAADQRLRFAFTQIDLAEPTREFSFTLATSEAKPPQYSGAYLPFRCCPLALATPAPGASWRLPGWSFDALQLQGQPRILSVVQGMQPPRRWRLQQRLRLRIWLQ